MSRIKPTFEQRRAQRRCVLIPYITAGDPDPALTVPMMHALVAAGADIIELGVPFSDPMADGPAIQRASERALAHQVTLRQVMSMAAEFRLLNQYTPVVLMGYANPVERMGYEQFALAAASSGVDGIILVDIPPEENNRAVFTAHGLDSIFLLSPTTSDTRMELVARQASGFVYYVSLKGVTGSSALDLAEVAQRVPKIRQRCALPVGVGFGIRDAHTAAAIGQIADAVVIGSRLIEEIEQSPRDQVIARVGAWLSEVRVALDAHLT